MLSLANSYIVNKRPDRAAEKLNQLVEKYPNTKAAQKAKELLDQVNNELKLAAEAPTATARLIAAATASVSRIPYRSIKKNPATNAPIEAPTVFSPYNHPAETPRLRPRMKNLASAGIVPPMKNVGMQRIENVNRNRKT